MAASGPEVTFSARLSASASIALVTPYFPFFDGVFPDQYRQRQERNAAELAQLIGAAGYRVHHLGLTDSEQCSVEHGAELARLAPSAVVIAPMMAAPATHSIPVVEAVGRPVVVCQVVRRTTIPIGYNEVDATEDSTLLGATMVCAGLRKHGHRFAHVVWCPDEASDDLYRFIDGALAVTGLAPKRIGVVGGSLEGYVDVEISADQLYELGLVRIDVPGSEVLGEFGATTDADADAAATALGEANFAFEMAAETIRRDLRLSVALQRVVRRHELDAVALNCHDAVFRRGSAIGIPACLAGSTLASAGCPVTCTGDVSTIIALLIAQQFTPDVLYCEPFTFGYTDGRIILGSCGIGTAAMAAPDHPPRVCANYAYPGVAASGACTRFGLPAGPATMIAYVPAGAADPGSAHVIWTTGELTGEYFPDMHGPNAVLRLDSADPSAVLARWAAAGPAHHVALAAADLRVELETMNRLGSTPLARIA